MNFLKSKLKNIMSDDKYFYKLKGFVSGFALSLMLVAGVVYAWNAVWHGTDWIQTGEIIKSKEIAENFEYLYQKTIKKDELQDCFGSNKKLEIRNQEFVCADYTPKGCKLRYRVKTDTDESDWQETDWGSANGGDWVYGAPAFVTGNPATLAYDIGIMCDEQSNMKIAYRFRGNRGPYNPNEKFVTSGSNTWSYGGYTTQYSKSCNIKGGNGGCGTPMDITSQSGPLLCDIKARYNGFVSYKPGAWRGPSDSRGTTYGSSSANTNCNGDGCSIEMAIKCQ